MSIFKKVEDEIFRYWKDTPEISDGVFYSEYRLKRRISLFENKTIPGGKVDEIGQYNYWYDIITQRRDAEVKNLRVDTNNFRLFSRALEDFPIIFIMNSVLDNFLTEKGIAIKLKEDVEYYSSWGNILWKKVGKKWKRLDLRNIILSNTAAETINDTDIIERYLLSESELESKRNHWNSDAIDGIKDNLGNKLFSATMFATKQVTSDKIYEIFERTGQVSEKEFNEAQGIKGGDPNKFFLAKVILAGLQNGGGTDNKYVLFAEKIDSMEDFYIEAHRGSYKGRWMREGITELLFDHQVRANEIGNQISRALNWGSKVIFRSADQDTYENIITDMDNGNIIRSADMSQVRVRVQGIDQLIADWNRNIQEADKTANSLEVVRGDQLKAGTPFRLGALLDQNANKLFVFLRQKLTIPYKRVFREWILPQLVEELDGETLIDIVGDQERIEDLRRMQATEWFNNNLARIGPMAGNPEIREFIIESKYQQLLQEEPKLGLDSKAMKSAISRIDITISGENVDTEREMETIASLLQYERDPVRISHLLDRIYKTQGIPLPPRPTQEIPIQEQNENVETTT